MVAGLKTLLFCDDCSCLALAELNGEILCTDCLLKKVTRTSRRTGPSPARFLAEQAIIPLETSEEARAVSMAS